MRSVLLHDWVTATIYTIFEFHGLLAVRPFTSRILLPMTQQLPKKNATGEDSIVRRAGSCEYELFDVSFFGISVSSPSRGPLLRQLWAPESGFRLNPPSSTCNECLSQRLLAKFRKGQWLGATSTSHLSREWIYLVMDLSRNTHFLRRAFLGFSKIEVRSALGTQSCMVAH